ncbi:MAG: hypothetical protein JWN98_431 [Abditibacteriota bacterium]|nr:hypothetical protein [Abditibacteriota bacterium]
MRRYSCHTSFSHYCAGALLLLVANLPGLAAADAQTVAPNASAPNASAPNGTQSTLVATAPDAVVPLDASVKMFPYRDPWLPSRERWRDIADNPLRGFLSQEQPFSYRNDYTSDEGGAARQTQVTLSYSTSPGVPYFVGRIDATGLKPNFAYQLKLVGKPVKGTQGWGIHGDAVGNERLGYAGRWWCGHPIHASGTNFDDNHYLSEYKNALPGMEHNMYGYIYMGQFITDGAGNAHVDFFGDHPYHISWASWQGGAKDVLAGRWPVRSAPLPTVGNGAEVGINGDQYGYGALRPSTSVTLYYENEPGRTQPLTLPPGIYRCRFLITEESFHNPIANSPEGGYWKTVLASEDLVYDETGRIVGHDRDAANDVVFSIGAHASITAMKAKVVLSVTKPSVNTVKATTQIVVTDNIGRPIRGATVKGFWSGIHSSREVSGTTNSTGVPGTAPNSDGVVQFTSPSVRTKRGQCFRFIITDIIKTGRTWNKFPRPGAQHCL